MQNQKDKWRKLKKRSVELLICVDEQKHCSFPQALDSRQAGDGTYEEALILKDILW